MLECIEERVEKRAETTQITTITPKSSLGLFVDTHKKERCNSIFEMRSMKWGVKRGSGK